MTARLTPRGPDGDGFHFDEHVALGHRRLAIIDIRGGKQPLYAAEGHIVGIVNGEIYNFRALTKILTNLGHCFRTASDSEVVVHGYAQWGVDVLQHLEGQFAFAIWDSRQDRLVLARDRMGEKPLYYAILPDQTLAFSSELRSLSLYPGINTSVDPAALARYLVYEYVPAPHSIIRGAHKLLPGHVLIQKRNQTPHVTSYWDFHYPPIKSKQRLHKLAPAASLLKDTLKQAVAARLVADVPVGIFLSGGLDSSLIAAHAAILRQRDIKTFSIRFRDPSYDESYYARLAANAIGSQHHEHTVEATDLLQLIPQLGDLLDEPLGDGSLVPTYLLSKFAKQHVTVVLGGDGGDELFGGYPTFQAEAYLGFILNRIPSVCRHLLGEAGQLLASFLPVSTSNFSFDFRIKQLFRGIDATRTTRHQAWLASLLPQEVHTILHPDLVQEISRVDLYDFAQQSFDQCSSANRWDQLMYFYAKGYLGNDVLAKVDRASMQEGLEVRAPLLDTGVIDIACRAAPSLRIQGSTTKRLLKHSARGLVPDKIVDREKHGFGMPIASWLKHELREFAQDLLSPARLKKQNLFRSDAVEQLLVNHQQGHQNNRKVLWTLLAFQAWWGDGDVVKL